MSNLSRKPLEGNYRVARLAGKVEFKGKMEFENVGYYALFDEDIFEGDFVLYDNTWTNCDYRLGKVIEIYEKEGISIEELPTREVIAKIDFSDYEYRKECRSHLSSLKNRMDNILYKEQNLAPYKELAKTSPEMKELLSEYEDLAKEVNLF